MHIAHLATLAVALVDDVCGDAAVWFKIASIANRVSDRNPVNAWRRSICGSTKAILSSLRKSLRRWPRFLSCHRLWFLNNHSTSVLSAAMSIMVWKTTIGHRRVATLQQWGSIILSTTSTPPLSSLYASTASGFLSVRWECPVGCVRLTEVIHSSSAVGHMTATLLTETKHIWCSDWAAKVKFRSGVRHLKCRLRSSRTLFPMCHMDRHFKDLSNDVLQTILFAV